MKVCGGGKSQPKLLAASFSVSQDTNILIVNDLQTITIVRAKSTKLCNVRTYPDYQIICIQLGRSLRYLDDVHVTI